VRLKHPSRQEAQNWVPIILAIGVSTAINCICFGVLWDALRSDTPGLSENATQLLTGALGGMLGVLGAYIGFHAGDKKEGGPDE
jgi:hypothetical protein